MKRLLFISTLALLAIACHKEPYLQDYDGEYLVYTAPAEDVEFADYQTFDIVDSVLVIGQTKKPYYSQSKNAMALIHEFRKDMEKLGYIYTPSDPAAQLGIQVTFVERTERYVQYYDDPYWWLDYPGYWPASYWGDWNGWYYPRPVTYSYTTNALIGEMVDLTAEKEDGKLKIVWSAYIGGPASYSINYDVKRMMNSIDQAFKQSPYITRQESR
ncbi:MAG: DUF4136 domain-containing protein [Bacteroidales bacterium]|nr:DUF4136 domain-containing protein [Bacteroidales bacterium]